jgi:hypothetical protein
LLFEVFILAVAKKTDALSHFLLFRLLPPLAAWARLHQQMQPKTKKGDQAMTQHTMLIRPPEAKSFDELQRNQPTPGPYRSDGNTVKAVSHGRWFTLCRVDNKIFTAEGKEANAAFITRACNAHRDLLEALELCVDCLTDLSRLDDGTPSISALDQARAAIAKAKPPTA